MIIKRPAGRPMRRPAGVGSGRRLSRIAAAALSMLVVLIVAAPVIAKTSALFSDTEHAKIQVTAGAVPTTEPPVPDAPPWSGQSQGQNPPPLYVVGDKVSFNGHIWTAKQQNQWGSPPGHDGPGGNWLHACPIGVSCPNLDQNPYVDGCPPAANDPGNHPRWFVLRDFPRG